MISCFVCGCLVPHTALDWFSLRKPSERERADILEREPCGPWSIRGAPCQKGPDPFKRPGDGPYGGLPVRGYTQGPYGATVRIVQQVFNRR